MCDPVTLAGIALTVGSTVANYAASSASEAARNDALAAERVRQNSLNHEAEAINAQSFNRYDNVQPQQQARAKEIGDYVSGQSIEQTAPQDVLPSAASSNITVQEEANQRAKARQFTDRTGAALGDLRSFGDVLGDIGRGQARDASQIGQIGSFKAGSSNVLPYEVDQASHAGDGMRVFGDILGGLGSVGTAAGLSGQGLFGFGGMSPVAASAAGRGFVPTITGPALRLGSLYGG